MRYLFCRHLFIVLNILGALALIFFTQMLYAFPKNTQQFLLEVRINGQSQKDIADCLLVNDEQIWVNEQNLQQWDLHFPLNAPQFYQGQAYYCLNKLNDIKVRMNSRQLTLDITAPLDYFPSSTINLSPINSDPIRPTLPGIYLNYDVSLQHTNIAYETNAALLAELAYFNHYGIGTTDFIVKGGSGSPTQGIRLESIWTIDLPERMTSWYLGDSVTGQASWSGAVRFGGIQYATNFATQPYFVTFPLPAFSGQAVVPSTLSVFVNDALNVTQEIKHGPFTLNDIPVVTGEGTVKVVTNDVLGRQRETIIPYYASQQLLKPDLEDFSYEIGVARNNYGLSSFDYSQLIGVGTYARGLTNELTAGWHAELLSLQQTAGLSCNYLWDQRYIISSALALSHSQPGVGALLLLGIQRLTQDYSYGIQVSPATAYFTALGFVENQFAPSWQIQSYGTIGTPEWGTFSASYTYIQNRSPELNPFASSLQVLPNTQLLTLNYNRNIFNCLYFILGGIIDMNQSSNTIGFLSFIWTLDNDKSLTATTSFQQGDNQQTLFLNKDLPWGIGYGYNVSLTHGDPNQGQVYYAYQNDYGTYSGQVAKIGEQTNYLFEAVGSVLHFAGYTLLSRTLYDSFALVEVPDFDDICIYNRNVCVGTTNRQGVLLVPNLLAYQNNKVNIDARDFPLNSKFSILEREGTAYYRSGILMDFPVKHVNNIKFSLHGSQAIPAGAKIKLIGDPEEFYVGEYGSTFITTEQKDIVWGKVKWENGQCQFVINVPQEEAALYQLGVISCF